jgi:hypothetical protein
MEDTLREDLELECEKRNNWYFKISLRNGGKQMNVDFD